ncbi:hypothetical protein L798_10066 [Zootermopsis nevadensis]|uniref:Uncharacterized protein n=1 Tax=Zootermopsis nevadensis TaxID=136037 RepID=A0A067RBK8_ZOONE|nr:hypothetical protein L798_10066 [Zootermopsis nevadensis]
MSGMTSRFKHLYKRNNLVSEGGGREKRAKKKLEERHVSTIEHFCKERSLTGTAVDSPKLRLQKWKEERLQKKLLIMASKKPPFKCGIVHHSLGSPYHTVISKVSCIKTLPKLARLREKTFAVKKNPFPSFAPSDFKFKVSGHNIFLVVWRNNQNVILCCNKSFRGKWP